MLLRSGDLHTQDAQCAENDDGRKISYQIISRLGAVGVQKGHFGCPKIQFYSKMAKFAGWTGIDLTLIFCIFDFFLCNS